MRRLTLGVALAFGVGVAGCGQGASGGLPSKPERSPFRVQAGSGPLGGSGPGSPAAYVPSATPLRATPGGRSLTTLPVKTDFGSPQVVAVRARQGNWLEVVSSRLVNGHTGWIAADRARLFRVDYSIEANLSRRELVVRHGARMIARTKMAIGRTAAPTPTGNFAVTDKLLINKPGSPYACCVLALSAHQPHTPQEWGGGDRIAIHATADPSSIGQAVSLGCMRIATNVMRRLVRIVPLGTPVRIR